MRIVFLILSILSFSALASVWMPVSEIKKSGSATHTLQSECEKYGPCLQVEDPEVVSSGFASVVNDWGPEKEVVLCEGQTDCELKSSEKACDGSHKFIDALYTKVYCVDLLGQELVLDLTGYNAHKAQRLAQAQLEAGIAQAKKLRECGERVMALMLVRNQPKQLTTAQVKQLVSTYSSIKSLLESGSLVSAKEEILAVQADGILVTDTDKTALAGEVDKCLGL